jgi:hypothetical protein
MTKDAYEIHLYGAAKRCKYNASFLEGDWEIGPA